MPMIAEHSCDEAELLRSVGYIILVVAVMRPALNTSEESVGAVVSTLDLDQSWNAESCVRQSTILDWHTCVPSPVVVGGDRLVCRSSWTTARGGQMW